MGRSMSIHRSERHGSQLAVEKQRRSLGGHLTYPRDGSTTGVQPRVINEVPTAKYDGVFTWNGNLTSRNVSSQYTACNVSVLSSE
uniref:Uncharacterized protein n=1 Tax=Oryza glumipatula TaxID=40148 RepID=A0A0D9Y3Y9_9ORYZ